MLAVGCCTYVQLQVHLLYLVLFIAAEPVDKSMLLSSDCHEIIAITVSITPFPDPFSSCWWGDVTHSDVAGSQKCRCHRHSAIPAEAVLVSDELWCLAGVLIKERQHQSTPPSTAQVEGGKADRLQAGSPCLQVLAGGSTVVSHRRPLQTPRLDVVYVLPRHRRWLSAVCGCQPSITELFQSPSLTSETVFRNTSHHHHHWPPSAVASRFLSSGAASHDFTTLLSYQRSDIVIVDTLIVVSHLLTNERTNKQMNRQTKGSVSNSSLIHVFWTDELLDNFRLKDKAIFHVSIFNTDPHELQISFGV